MYSLTQREPRISSADYWQTFKSPVQEASAKKHQNLLQAQPSITMVCGMCEDQAYIMEEMYICFNCKEVLCRTCLVDEIDYYFCPQCQQTVSQYDAENFKNRCSRCYECPNCLNVVIMMLNSYKWVFAYPRNYYFFLCQSCHWSSADVGMIDQEIKELVVRANNSGLTPELKLVREWFAKKCDSMRNVETQREKDQNRRDALQRHRKTLKFLFKDKIIRSETSQFQGEKFTFTDLDEKMAKKEEKQKAMRKLEPINYKAIEQRARMDEVEKDPANRADSMDLSFSQLALDVEDENDSSQLFREEVEPATDYSKLLLEDETDYLSLLDKEFAPSKNPKSLSQELSEGFSLDKISTLPQRIHCPESQSRIRGHLSMQHLPLRTIRSKRCQSCLKFVVKPNPPKAPHSSDKYEAFQMASMVVKWLPKVKIYKFYEYTPTSIKAQVRLTNSLKAPVKVKFLESKSAVPIYYGIPSLPAGDFTIDMYDTSREVTGKDQLGGGSSGTEGGEQEDLVKREGNSIVLKFGAVRDEAHAAKPFKIRCVMVTEFTRLESEVCQAEIVINFGTFQLKHK